MRNEPRHEDQMQREQGQALTTQRGSQGDWTGYVQPYRYYGPGYRGVGYYAVFYQGVDPSGMNQEEMDEQPAQFDPRNVPHGRGQGAGAAWDRRRYGWSGWTEPPGAWRDRARQFGEFAGRGPKGYKRSDERIREDVSDRLTENPDLDASEVEVNVADGVVTLAGDVDSRWAKRLAEDIAEMVPGVRDVMNKLGVGGQYELGRETGGARGTTRATATSRQARNGRRPATANR